MSRNCSRQVYQVQISTSVIAKIVTISILGYFRLIIYPTKKSSTVKRPNGQSREITNLGYFEIKK